MSPAHCSTLYHCILYHGSCAAHTCPSVVPMVQYAVCGILFRGSCAPDNPTPHETGHMVGHARRHAASSTRNLGSQSCSQFKQFSVLFLVYAALVVLAACQLGCCAQDRVLRRRSARTVTLIVAYGSQSVLLFTLRQSQGCTRANLTLTSRPSRLPWGPKP